MTGRAAGYCAGYHVPGVMNPIRGFGSGSGRGRGRGFGRGWGRGFGRGRFVYPQPVGVQLAYPQPIQSIAQPQTPEQEVAALENYQKGLEAEKAWRALQTGLDLKDVIIKCYRQMGLALKEEQGIEREDFMTTGEFQHLLATAGVPYGPVHQLTRLFDAVRYGNWQPNPTDKHEAIQSLEAIMVYSRQNKGKK